MIDPKRQRIIGWLAFAGVFVSCGACGLIWQNQVQLALYAIIAADVILLPTFMILLRTRRRTKKIVQQREQTEQEQLDALAGVGDLAQPKQSADNQGE
jgi:ABC-type bacteriocin/lantibiotic exporter with double-glycine peptidase domain